MAAHILLLLLLLLWFLPLSLLSGSNNPLLVAAAAAVVVNCTNHDQCGASAASACIDSVCGEFRPFYHGGCLHQRLPEWKKVRVCNSEDPIPEAVETGACRIADFDYMEIRIATQNWESAFFEAYLLQILLSELLDVPTTLETGSPDAKLNFYDPHMPFDYGISGDWGAFDRSSAIRDCTVIANNRHREEGPPGNDDYKSCAHVVTENWDNNNEWVKDQLIKGTIELPAGLGILGKESWFMPKFTIDRHPSLASDLGLRGGDKKKNNRRRKLAETFLRPTKWKDYCDYVSPDRCVSPDNVTRRGPRDEEEEGMYFAPDLYAGHFRKTDKNDCDKNPDTCTGHIVDFPCGWSSHVEQIATHLGIALESNGDEPGSGGFKYSEMVQILMASNATKSDIVLQWWTPEASYSKLLGSDSELRQVLLPPPTPECVAGRVRPDDRCSENATVRVGSPFATCDEAAHPLHKIVSPVLYESVYDDESVSEGSRSPGYDAVKLFAINNVQLDGIFEYWFERQSRGAGQSAREAVCDWVVDNMDYLRDFIPRSYPRVLREEKWDILLVASTAVAGFAATVVLWTGWMVFRHRDSRTIRYAQIEFLWLLLAGLLTLSFGAIFSNASTDGACLAAMWLVNFGYTLGLVPLLVKVTAINRLMSAANKMRRVVLKRESLFGAVLVINGILAILLLLWSLLDAPVRTPEYKLTDTVTADGETVVSISFYCSSESKTWRYVVVSVNVALLLWATVLAFQTHRIRQEFNESLVLATMIYSHAVFLVLRLITFFLEGSVRHAILAHCQSLVYSVDTIATIAIYFVPKFVASDQDRERGRRGYQSYLHQIAASAVRRLPVVTLESAESDQEEAENDKEAENDDEPPDAPANRQDSMFQRVRHINDGGGPSSTISTENDRWVPKNLLQEQGPETLRARTVTRRNSF